MYGPVFESMFTGSMFGAGAPVFAVMTYAIAACDKNGHLEINPELLAAMIGCDVDEVRAAIKVLQDEDPRSRNKELDGVRLLHKGEFDYLLVNYGYYQELAKAKNKQERDRIRMKQKRDAERAEKAMSSNTVANSRQQSPGVVHSKTVDGRREDVCIGSSEEPLSSAKPSDDHRLTILVDVLDHWNSKPGLASVKANTIIKAKTAAGRKRRAAALARITEHPDLNDWRTVIDRIAARPHCNGDNDRGWIADVGYLFGVETFDNHWTGKFSKPASRNPSNTHSTGPDIGEWMYGTYRRSDHDAHHEDDRWTEYTEWASNNFDYETAPTFSEWRKG